MRRSNFARPADSPPAAALDLIRNGIASQVMPITTSGLSVSRSGRA
jgi:hypothetical protein